MTRSNYNHILFFLLIPLFSIANDGDFTKNIHKEYDVPVNATIELINKYGYVKVHAWDKRIASIDVNILANTSSQDRANEIFDRIQVNFTTTNNYIKAETSIATNKGNSGWWDWKSWIGWNDSKSSYKINYDVYMPVDLYLKLSLRYGDAFVDKLERDATIKVSYGHLRMDDLVGDLDLDLAYSDGNFNNIKNGKIHLRYSDVNMASMQNGTLNFRYSDIKMKNAGTIKSESAYGELAADKISSIDLNSKYDDIVIQSVDEVFASTGYTDVDIARINKRSSFTSSYGDIIIRDVDAGFSNIDIKSSYTDVRINTHGAPYKIDFSGSYTDIKYNPEMNTSYLVDKSNSKSVKGYFKSESNSGTIKASMSYGGLRID